MSFSLVDKKEIEAIGVELQHYKHQRLGCSHYHFACDSKEQVFMVAFRTVPTDSTGVAHILEHTVLCGSKRYPVRDPFFLMTRRSLNTFMNAFTASDWTAYPFASCNRTDFYNLLDVYLDAAFFPILSEQDFRQEGWRYDFATSGDPASELVYKGVVFNEMKGAMSTPARVLWHELCSYLYPTVTYHYNSGGEPEAIPDLSYQQLVDFHKKHYHPSNAIFLTFGSEAPTNLQTVFEKRVLKAFEPAEAVPLVPLEKPITTPISAQGEYAFDEEDSAQRTHLVISWLWGESADINEVLRAHLLSGVLLDNGGSPLRVALENSDLGQSPSPLCGLEDEHRQMQFTVGLEGCEAGHIESLEALVLSELEKVVEGGIDVALVEGVMHQLELGQREIAGGGYPYGLGLILSGLTAAIHGGSVVDRVDIDAALERLRKECTDPRFIPKLVQSWLLNNLHRVSLQLVPSLKKSKQMLAKEQQRLQQVSQQMEEQQKQDIVQFNQQLQMRQEAEEDVSVLPKIHVKDVERTITEVQPIANSDQVFSVRTNGLSYIRAIQPMPSLNAQEIETLPWLINVAAQLGSAGRDYKQTQIALARYTGGISMNAHIGMRPEDVEKHNAYLVFSGKALNRYVPKLVEYISDLRSTVHFDEHDRLGELFAQLRYQSEQGVAQKGHLLAMDAAASGLNAHAQFNYQWSGLKAVQRIIKLHNSLQNSGTEILAQQLENLYRKFACDKPLWLLIGDEEGVNIMQQHVVPQPQSISGHPLFKQSSPKQQNVVWTMSTQVHYCGQAHAAVPASHPDAAALVVLSHFLRNGFLHTAIREQGGAYGGGAQYSADTASFRFFSYRDPRLEDTLQDFNNSIDWLVSQSHDTKQLDAAILGAIAKMDAPLTPAAEASRTFFGALHGHDLEWRSLYRERILDVSINDLRRTGELYLTADCSRAVISNMASAERCSAQGYKIEKLGV